MALETKSSASLLPSRSESMPVLESTEDKTVAGLDETKDLNELPPTVTFVSSDNQEFELDRKDVQISILVKTSLEADPHATTIPILQVDGKTLAKIVEYCTHHQGTEPPLIEKPLRSKIMLDVVRDPWDANFIDSIGHNRQALYDLTLVRAPSPKSCFLFFSLFCVAGRQLHGHQELAAFRVCQGGILNQRPTLR